MKIKKLLENQVIKVVGIVAILVALPAALLLIRNNVKITPQADLTTVDVFIEPQTASLPPNTTVRVYLDSKNQKISFTRFVVNFDRTKIQLLTNPIINASFPNVIQTTDIQTANQSGRIIFVLAVPPNSTAPSGIFEVANFQIGSVSSYSNDSASLAFNVSDMQIVEETFGALPINARNGVFTLNPVSTTATPIVTSTPIPTVITATPTAWLPTSTPTVTVPTTSPTPIATVTPVPTSTPTPLVANTAPVITSSTLNQGYVGVNYTAYVYATDVNTSNNLTMTVSSLPSPLVFGSCTQSIVNNLKRISCRISGVPNRESDSMVTFTVNDGTVSVSKALRLVIR